MGSIIGHDRRYIYVQSGHEHCYCRTPYDITGSAREYRARDMDYHRLYVDDDDTGSHTRPPG
jgi:hypothetical protein